eukprot:TRINITY_DN18231_c0_g1_i1.p1 TRINITY_DN18231_c0_g1~~TRINITY_DN18231_c0_g1_i1.p1  ORF type:complete len:294 (+),score=42.12 TRINITY_DN18231_c0_g1_i1:196-1077(+)
MLCLPSGALPKAALLAFSSAIVAVWSTWGEQLLADDPPDQTSILSPEANQLWGLVTQQLVASSAELTSAETTAIRFQAEASDSPPLVARQELGKMRGSLAAALSDLHALQALLKDVKAKDHKPETQKVRPEAEEPPREPPLAVQLFMAPSSQTKAHPLTMPTSNSIATADTLPPRVVKYKDSEANQTNQPANSKACLPAANGCAHLKTKFLCLRSFDDSNLIEERGRKVAGEACVWCGGVRCVIGASSSEESGLRKSACAPRDWLLRGQGFAFQKFVAAFYYKVAKCELPPQK